MTAVFILMSNLSGGGAERVMADIYNNLPAEVGCQIITIDEMEARYEVKKEPISLHFKRRSHLPQTIVCLWKIPLSIVLYSRLLIKYKPEVSVSILPVECVVNIFACIFTGVKPIISVRGNPSSKYIPWSSKLLYAISLHMSRILNIPIITNSNDVKKNLVLNYRLKSDNIQVIYNPKNMDLINIRKTELISEEFFDTEHPIIITVGRLVKYKGQWHLLRVFAQLQKKIKCKLVFCGDGDERSYLESLAKNLNIDKDVLFLGWCENPYKYINRATIFAYPSLSDALPNVLIETLLIGCPIVSADCDHGPREILGEGEFGLLSLPLDAECRNATDPLSIAEEDLLNKITSLLQDTELRAKFTLLGQKQTESYSMPNAVAAYIRTFNMARNK